MAIPFPTVLYPSKAIATSSFSSIHGVDGSGAEKRLPFDATNSDFATVSLFSAATIPALVNSVTIAGYTTAGDGGGHTKVRISTPSPAKAWHSQSADGAWWAISEVRTSPRMFGAKDDGTDAKAAVQGAIDYGKPIILDGNFTLQSALTCTGGISMTGYGRDRSSLTWPSGASSGGITVTATSYSQTMFFKDFAIYVGMDLSGGNVISCSWQGLGLSDYFKTKLIAQNLHLEATGTGKFDKGIYINFCNTFYVEKCFIQNQVSLSGITAAAYPMTACIYVDNDELTHNTDNLRMSNNELFGATYGIYVKDVEACWFRDNDIQVCWKGIEIYNGYTKANQYRFSGNHIGVFDTGIKVFNARQALLDSNEMSYRIGRTDTATVDMILLDQVSDGQVNGGTIRGNYSNLLGSITVRGVRTMSTVGASDPTNFIRIHGVGFRDLMIAMQIEANTSSWKQSDNTFNNVLTARLVNNSTAGSVITEVLGEDSTGIAPISGQTHALLLTKSGASALGVNRDNDGVLIGLYAARTLLGGFSVRGTATYTAWVDGGGSVKMAVNATGIGFFGTVPVAQKAGWTPATGTATRTTFDTSTVTLPVLAEHVKALIDDFHTTAGYGLLKT